MSIPEINVPLCPTCGDPVTSGCYPADGICAVVGDEQSDVNAIEAPGMSALTDEEWAALGNGEHPMIPRYVMATKATHQLGDLSRDVPDLAWITGEDGDNWVGVWITGFGYIDVRFPKTTTRDLTPAEREHYAGQFVELNGEVQPMLADDQCPNCTSDRKDFLFMMPTKGVVTLADVAPCGDAWHDEATR